MPQLQLAGSVAAPCTPHARVAPQARVSPRAAARVCAVASPPPRTRGCTRRAPPQRQLRLVCRSETRRHSSSGAAEDTPWLQDLSEELVTPDAALQARLRASRLPVARQLTQPRPPQAREARMPPRDRGAARLLFNVLLVARAPAPRLPAAARTRAHRAAVAPQAPYAAAVALLLSFTPDLPSALSATPQQALLFLLAVFMADRAVRRWRGG
jgi:hypothetical protein